MSGNSPVSSPANSPRSAENLPPAGSNPIVDESTVIGTGGNIEPSTGASSESKNVPEVKTYYERMTNCAQQVWSGISSRAWQAGTKMGEWGKWTVMGPGYIYLGLIGLPVIAYLLVDRTLKAADLEQKFNAIGWAAVLATAAYSWSRVLPKGIENTFLPKENLHPVKV